MGERRKARSAFMLKDIDESGDVVVDSRTILKFGWDVKLVIM
jgi:hypothetical protein